MGHRKAPLPRILCKSMTRNMTTGATRDKDADTGSWACEEVDPPLSLEEAKQVTKVPALQGQSPVHVILRTRKPWDHLMREGSY